MCWLFERRQTPCFLVLRREASRGFRDAAGGLCWLDKLGVQYSPFAAWIELETGSVDRVDAGGRELA